MLAKKRGVQLPFNLTPCFLASIVYYMVWMQKNKLQECQKVVKNVGKLLEGFQFFFYKLHTELEFCMASLIMSNVSEIGGLLMY